MKRYILIGHPLGHSVSPAIHGAAYQCLGATAEYVLCDVPSEAGVLSEVDRIRRGEIAGANVTVPWKQVALRAADVLDESARVTRAANVLSRNDAGQVVAHNTDAWGLADELELAKKELGPVALERDTALVVGNGGAALAAVVGCGYAGLSRVIVAARKWDSSVPRSAWPLVLEFEGLGARCVPLEAASWQAERARILVIVQATSAGMKGTVGGELLADSLELGTLPRSIAYDLVYNPSVTPFLASARAAGHLACGGLGMLVEQAARALEIWFGVRPPRAPLLEAAQNALGS